MVILLWNLGVKQVCLLFLKMKLVVEENTRIRGLGKMRDKL